MILTKRDCELFTKLHSYGLLTTKQIETLLFEDIATTTVLRRLRILEEDDYLRRIPLFDRGSVAWGLTDKGAREISILPPKRNFRRDLLEHELKLVELRLELERTGFAGSWIPEHEIRRQVFAKNGVKTARHLVVPDGIMGVETCEGFKESVAVELELNFKNSTRYFDLFLDYRNRKKLGYLWYVVSNPTIGRHAESVWPKCAKHSSGPKFCWSPFEEVLKDPQNAPIHEAQDTLPLKEIWKSKSTQSAAHAMSTLPLQNPNPQNSLTA